MTKDKNYLNDNQVNQITKLIGVNFEFMMKSEMSH